MAEREALGTQPSVIRHVCVVDPIHTPGLMVAVVRVANARTRRIMAITRAVYAAEVAVSLALYSLSKLSHLSLT